MPMELGEREKGKRVGRTIVKFPRSQVGIPSGSYWSGAAVSPSGKRLVFARAEGLVIIDGSRSIETARTLMDQATLVGLPKE